jgi:hypothetical protein
MFIIIKFNKLNNSNLIIKKIMNISASNCG